MNINTHDKQTQNPERGAKVSTTITFNTARFAYPQCSCVCLWVADEQLSIALESESAQSIPKTAFFTMKGVGHMFRSFFRKSF